jgi:putative PIN family toxin of toxin-antitoxin system
MAARRGLFELYISPPILGEISRILSEKFSWSDEMLHREAVRLSGLSSLVHPDQTIDAVPDDADDNRILECAVAARAWFLVTGDHHLLRMSTWQGIRILKVSDVMRLFPTL